jgi:predicted nuclease of predicted toxin-antitoxin system
MSRLMSATLALRHAEDSEIASFAKTNDLCIVTGDWGFSDIRFFRPQDYAGIVVIGLPARATAAQLLEVLRVLLDRPDLIALLPGRLAIVEKARVRLRPRP